MTDRHILLVTGMHRSGTSALARLLNLLGASLGSELAPAAPGNPRGFWEERAIVSLNDECLNNLGVAWDDPSPLPDGWLDAPWMRSWRERVTTHLRQTHNSSPLVAIKDPRLCRLLPAWLQILEPLDFSPHVILVVRQPDEVAQSLARRDGLMEGYTKQLWLRYMLEAESGSRGQSRIFTSFLELLTDWKTLAERIRSELGIEWPVAASEAEPEVARFLNTGMRHSSAGYHAKSNGGPTRLLAASVYAYARASSLGGSVPPMCWDEACRALQDLQQTASQELSRYPDEKHARHVTGSPALGLWEPAPLISEVVQARLYYRKANESADERQHVAAVVPTATKPMHAEFTLPAAATVDFIRFDPTMRRGIYRVLAVSINGQDLAAPEVKLATVHERQLPDETGALFCFFSDDDDPHIELDMRTLGLPEGQPLHVGFTFECDSLYDRLGREFAQREHALNNKLAELKQDMSEIADVHIRIETAQQHVKSSVAYLLAASKATSRHEQAEMQCKLIAAGWAQSKTAKNQSRGTDPLTHTTNLHALPSGNLQLLAQYPESPALWWRSEGDRSFFEFEMPENAKLVAGWYVLSMEFLKLNSRALQSTIEIDYGSGFGESDCVDPSVSIGMRQRLLLRFKHRVYGLRFYPGASTGEELLMSRPSLRRISRAEALLRVVLPWVRIMRSQDRDWGDICRRGWRILTRGSLASIADELHSKPAEHNHHQPSRDRDEH